MPGKREEQKGLLRHGARLCAAMQAIVPCLSVLMRKCYGAAAFLLLQTRAQGSDLVLALETADIGVMGEMTTDAVMEIDQWKVGSRANFPIALGLIDEIVKPDELRQLLGNHLKLLYKKQTIPGPQRNHFIDP